MTKLIIFESPTMGGKTTISKQLVNILRKNNKVYYTKNALSKSPMGESIRDLPLDSLKYSTSFYWADFLIENTRIKQLLNNGSFVVCDRYDLSIAAYREVQGLKHQSVILEGLHSANLTAKPDLTVLLAPPTNIIINRLSKNSINTIPDSYYLNNPDSCDAYIKYCINTCEKLNRNYIVIDSHKYSIKECIDKILSAI